MIGIRFNKNVFIEIYPYAYSDRDLKYYNNDTENSDSRVLTEFDSNTEFSIDLDNIDETKQFINFFIFSYGYAVNIDRNWFEVIG